MELKTGKLNRWIILCVVGLLLAAAAVVVILSLTRGRARTNGAAYALTDGAAGTVRFVERTTTAEEYEALRAACDACRDTAEQSSAAAVSETVVVSEETFVDTDTSEEVPRDSAVYVESEMIYLEGLVIARYASQWGDHLTVAACYDDDGLPMVLSLDGLELEGLLQVPVKPGDQAEDGAMDENAFLYSMEGCVIALLFGDVEWEAVSSRFTESGAAALRRVGQTAGGAESSGMDVLLCGLGSTSSTELLADRIYFRCRLRTDEASVVLDILLKLNSDLLVYDVDLM